MKRSILICISLLMMATASAQEPQRSSVVVEYFSKSATVSSSYKDMIRNSVLTYITNSGRLNVIDASNSAALKLSSTQSDADVIPTPDNIRQGAMKESGGNFLLTGIVTSAGATRERYDNGTIYYKGYVSFSLNITDLDNGRNIGAKEFKYGGITGRTGKTSMEATTNTIEAIAGSMVKFVNDHFKFDAKILQIESMKNQKAKTVYINAGKSMGLKPGQLFLVFQEKDIVGHKSRTEVGKLIVSEVQGDDLSLCKVRVGGDIIWQASNNPDDIVLKVESAGLSFGSSLLIGL